ncbi:restriction endonuclease subunit S [Pseudoalteromonas mariniglutinosa]
MSELPKGWKIIRLRDEATSIKGKKPKILELDLADGLVPYIDIKAFEKGILTKYASPDAGVNADEIDTLMVWDGARSGLVGNGVHGVIGSTLVKIKPKFSHHSYLHYFLRSKYSYINSNTKGTGIPHVDPAKLWELDYPLAPINEQIRIVNKLDSILAKVNKAQARLDKIPAILKRFRQSVLAAATSGELTKEWREGNDHQWPKVQLKDVGTGFNYGSSAKSKPEGEVPVLRMGNLQGGKLDWENLVFTSDEAEIQKYLLESGDVLFNRTNSPELVGKTSIYRGEQKAIYAGYLIRVKGSKRLNTEFLNIQLNSPHARDYCWQVKTDGVSQSNINAKKLQAYEFDLPPMSEQLEIVRRVNELFSRADLFKRQYLDARKAFSRLTQSILAKAFRGELVAQDPTDESASELLENIKKQRQETLKQVKKKQTAAKKESPQVKNISSTPVEEKIQFESEVLTILQNASKDLSAQQIIDQLMGNSFEQVDMLFTDLKKLLDSKLITQVGSGESCTFKVIKK